jgi:hypothetical protein
MLTLDPARRAGRALAAAQAKAEAGGFDAARDLLAMVEAGPLSEFQQARVDLVRARIAFVTSRGSDAPPLLLRTARRLEPVDSGLSRATYLAAAMFAGRLGSGGGVREVAEAARVARRRTGTATGDRRPVGLSRRDSPKARRPAAPPQAGLARARGRGSGPDQRQHPRRGHQG